MGTDMQPDPLGAILAGGLADVSPFGASSRYRGIPLATVEIGGVEIRYLRRRFVPPPGRFTTIREHVVVEGDRPDNIAAAELGDPEMFWQLADANGVLHPGELVAEIGRRLRVTLPEGIPEAPDAA